MLTSEPSHVVRPAASGGFTLVETLIATTVLAAAVIGLVMPLSLAAGHQRRDLLHTTAVGLAGQMIERLTVMDQKTLAKMRERTEQGKALTGWNDKRLNDRSLEGFSRRVTVQEIQLALPGEEQDEAERFWLATVVVRHTDLPGEEVCLRRLIAQQ